MDNDFKKDQLHLLANTKNMNYVNLHLENIEFPAEVEKKAKVSTEWKIEAAPGIYVKVWYAHEAMDKNKHHNFWVMFWKEEGLKYGVVIEYDLSVMASLNKLRADSGWKTWKDYFMEKLNFNPLINTSQTIDIGINRHFCVIFTSNKGELNVLLTEISKAIRELSGKLKQSVEQLAHQALINIEAIEDYAYIIRRGGQTVLSFQELKADIEQLLEKHGAARIVSVLASSACIDGFWPYLQEINDTYSLKKFFIENPSAKSNLFMAIQKSVCDIYILELPSRPSQSYIIRFIKLFVGVLQLYGFNIRPNGVETVIRCMENDAMAGIYFNTYELNESYEPSEFGNANSKIWEKINVSEIIRE